MRVSPDPVSQTEWQEKNLEHLRYEYDLKPSDLVIDIGAYRGEWAAQIFSRYKCGLILVEPGPWIRGFPIGEVINKAASINESSKQFGGAFYYSSSCEDGNTEYPCFDINSLLSRYDEIALVKINIEGAEYELLSHVIEAGLHKRIRNLQVQFHRIEDEPCDEMYTGIETALKESHQLTWRYPFCWENWERA